jgi:hypothetical protein
MKNAVFWDAAPCRSCVNRRFGGTYLLHLQDRKIRERGTRVSKWLQSAANYSRWFLARGFFYPEDGGDTILRNVGSHKIYTATHPRRRHSSALLLGHDRFLAHDFPIHQRTCRSTLHRPEADSVVRCPTRAKMLLCVPSLDR